jgi:hypothetical protein
MRTWKRRQETAASSSELAGGVPLHASGGRGFMNKKYYCIESWSQLAPCGHSRRGGMQVAYSVHRLWRDEYPSSVSHLKTDAPLFGTIGIIVMLYRNSMLD